MEIIPQCLMWCLVSLGNIIQMFFYVYKLKAKKTIHYLIECVVYDEISLIVKQQVPKFSVAITSTKKR